MISLSVIATVLTACSMAGDGDAALCREVYFGSRAAAAVIPSYTVKSDGRAASHGLVWELGFDIPKELWPRYFTLGAPTDESKWDLGRGQSAFEVGFAAGFAWYPRTGEAEGRFTARARLFSLAFPESPVASFLHLYAGLGGFVDDGGVGPRIELRARVGHVAWGGLVVACGFQPRLERDRSTGDFSLGFEAPWVWWW